MVDCCCCCQKEPVIISLEALKTGYIPGECVLLTGKIMNHSDSDVEYTKITIREVSPYTVLCEGTFVDMCICVCLCLCVITYLYCLGKEFCTHGALSLEFSLLSYYFINFYILLAFMITSLNLFHSFTTLIINI